MKKLLGKKLNKNGFTLAELPLLFGATDSAEEARNKANQRAVKSIVTKTVLTNESLSTPQRITKDEYGFPKFETAESGVTARFWMANAFIAENGDILIEDIIPFTYDNDTNYDPNELIPITWEWVDKGKNSDDYPIAMNGDGLVTVEDTVKWVNEHGGAWCYSFTLTNAAEEFESFFGKTEP